MGKNKPNTSAVSVDVLKTNLETAEIALNAITETVSVEEKQLAQTAFDEAKKALDALDENASVEDGENVVTAFENAENALNIIKDLPTPEEKQLAQTAFDEAKLAYEKAVNTVPGKNVKQETLRGTFVISPTGRFSLGYNVGESADLPKLQALELEEAGYFKLSK